MLDEFVLTNRGYVPSGKWLSLIPTSNGFVFDVSEEKHSFDYDDDGVLVWTGGDPDNNPHSKFLIVAIEFLQNLLGIAEKKVPHSFTGKLTMYSAIAEKHQTDDELLNFLLNKETNAYLEKAEYLFRNRRLTDSDAIENLILMKKTQLLIRFIECQILYKKFTKNYSGNSITATDIANYTFCSANYAISKSYNLLQTPSKESGRKFHEQVRLLSNLPKFQDRGNYRRYRDEVNREMFERIQRSELIYSGHLTEQKQIFFRNRDFIGQPDYIFRDANGRCYIVEEKFTEAKKISTPYNSHLLQVASYVYGILEYEIEDAYILYWHYSRKFGDYSLRGFKSHKIDRNDFIRYRLQTQFLKLRGIVGRNAENNAETFDITRLNIQKCNSCSVAMICRHRTAKFEELRFPYSSGSYFEFNKVKLPQQLEASRAFFQQIFSVT